MTSYLEQSAQLAGFHVATALIKYSIIILQIILGKKLHFTSVRFCSEINSRGKVLMPFLCNDKVFKLCKRPTLDGICSMELSQRLRACSWLRLPIASGISRIRLPPSESKCRLRTTKKNETSSVNRSVFYEFQRCRGALISAVKLTSRASKRLCGSSE